MDTVRDCGSHFIASLKLWVQHKVGKLGETLLTQFPSLCAFEHRKPNLIAEIYTLWVGKSSHDASP